MILRAMIRAPYGIDIFHGPLYNLRERGKRLRPAARAIVERRD